MRKKLKNRVYTDNDAPDFIEVRELLQHVISFMDLKITFDANGKIASSDFLSVLIVCKPFHFALINYPDFRRRFDIAQLVLMLDKEKNHIDDFQIRHPNEQYFQKSDNIFRDIKWHKFLSFTFSSVYIPNTTENDHFQWTYVQASAADKLFKLISDTSLTADLSLNKDDLPHFDEIKLVCENFFRVKEEREVFVDPGLLLPKLLNFKVSFLIAALLFCGALGVAYSVKRNHKGDAGTAVSNFFKVASCFFIGIMANSCFLIGLLGVMQKIPLYRTVQGDMFMGDPAIFHKSPLGLAYDGSCQFFNSMTVLFEKLSPDIEALSSVKHTISHKS